MNAALQSMIDRYQPDTPQEWENALREIVQELALPGLSPVFYKTLTPPRIARGQN